MLSKKQLKEINKLMGAMSELEKAAANVSDTILDLSKDGHKGFLDLAIYFEINDARLGDAFNELHDLATEVDKVLRWNDIVDLVAMYNMHY